MLNIGFRSFKQKEAAPMSAERRLGLGLDHRTRRVQKRSLFAHVLITKENISGIPDPSPALGDDLNLYGALGVTAAPLKSWLRRWLRRGGVALL